MRIFIIGGSLFIGHHLVKQLLERNQHEILLLNRGNHQENIPDGVEAIYGDRNQISEFRDQISDFRPDIVVDMIPFASEDSRVIVNVCSSLVDRIVAISSCDVYRAYDIIIGNIKDEIESVPLHENSPVRNEYYPYRNNTQMSEQMRHYDKLLAEMVYMNDARFKGTVLRLPIVYGPGDYQHRVQKYLKRIDDFRHSILVHEDLATWKSPYSYVENVAKAILLAIENEKAAGEIYNVSDSYDLTEYEWIEAIGKAADWNGEILIVPRDKYPDSLSFVSQDLSVDSSKIRSELGFSEKVSLNDGLQKAIEWERQNTPSSRKDLSSEYENEDKLIRFLKESRI